MAGLCVCRRTGAGLLSWSVQLQPAEAGRAGVRGFQRRAEPRALCSRESRWAHHEDRRRWQRHDVRQSRSDRRAQRADNIAFGPDGYLYVGEKYGGRIIRIAANGTHSVFALGFDNIEGVAFDPVNGNLYIGEIEKSTLWRVRN